MFWGRGGLLHSIPHTSRKMPYESTATNGQNTNSISKCLPRGLSIEAETIRTPFLHALEPR